MSCRKFPSADQWVSNQLCWDHGSRAEAETHDNWDIRDGERSTDPLPHVVPGSPGWRAEVKAP